MSCGDCGPTTRSSARRAPTSRAPPGSNGTSTRSTAPSTSCTTCRRGAPRSAAVDAQGAVAGAVYVPVLDEMFSAARGAGATLNGAPIADVRADVARRWRWSAPGSATSPSGGAPRAPAWQRCSPRSATSGASDRPRSTSASSACGRLDAYFEQYLNSWDIAAGVLIASEAGASPATSTATPSPRTASSWPPRDPRALVELIAAATVPSDTPDPLLAMSDGPSGGPFAHRNDGSVTVGLMVGAGLVCADRVGGSGIMGAWVHASWPSRTTSASARR